MAKRWVGLARKRRKQRVCKHRIAREGVRALGAAGVLVMAAAMNFALYPTALAEVISGERPVIGFVPSEPAGAIEPTLTVILDEEDVRLLAATAWAEARTEGEEGMRAVAHVMVNRIGERFGGDLRTVILAPRQFSAWNIGDPNRPLARNPERYARGGVNLETWTLAQQIAREVLSGQSVDPTDGALFYHTTAIRPYWSRHGEGARTIGAHIFYRDVPDQRARGRAPRVTQVADATPAMTAAQRGPRAGRVGGVIQYAAPDAAGQLLPSEMDAAAAEQPAS